MLLQLLLVMFSVSSCFWIISFHFSKIFTCTLAFRDPPGVDIIYVLDNYLDSEELLLYLLQTFFHWELKSPDWNGVIISFIFWIGEHNAWIKQRSCTCLERSKAMRLWVNDTSNSWNRLECVVGSGDFYIPTFGEIFDFRQTAWRWGSKSRHSPGDHSLDFIDQLDVIIHQPINQDCDSR